MQPTLNEEPRRRLRPSAARRSATRMQRTVLLAAATLAAATLVAGTQASRASDQHSRSRLLQSLTRAQPALLTQQSAETTESAAGQRTVAFAPLSSEAVQSQLQQWLTRAEVSSQTTQQIAALWQGAADGRLTAEDVLDRVVESLALADQGTQRFLEECRSSEEVTAPVYDGLRAEPFYQQSVSLYHARWLTQHRFYDEALSILEQLNPEGSVDPASIFFYRAVCQQRLLQAPAAQDSLSLLLNSTVDVPERFRAVAAMMQQELQQQAAGGLPEVARVMSDVQRRLDLGRSGEKVQQQEQQVITLLDKLLSDLEQQQQQQQQQGSGGGGGGSPQGQPEQGATESGIKGSAEEGLADRKELSESGAWGMLDKQAETQARELIRQKFPANYLDAISRYTRKIAERK